MQATHKIEMKVNDKQKTYFLKACGIARFTYNWGLDRWKELYEKEERNISGYSLKKEFNAIKASKYPWMYEVTKYASQQPFIHLQAAFSRFYKKLSKYPVYKKKGRRDSFYIGGDQIKVDGSTINIPLLGPVHLREELRYKGKINSATITRDVEKWYISIQVELDNSIHVKRPDHEQEVGVDLGISALAVTSDGLLFSNMRPLGRYLKKLKKLQKYLSRKYRFFEESLDPGLDKKEKAILLGERKNYQKLKTKIAKLHRKIRNLREDLLHKITSYLANNYTRIAIEDLNISGMIKNHNLARALSDVGMGKFRRYLEYKTKWRGTELTIVGRFYPSSKTCSNCGTLKKDLKLKDRTYECGCGNSISRDLNAAKNLVQWKAENGPGRVMARVRPVEIGKISQLIKPVEVTLVG
jgi:putative transposase